MFIGLLPYIKVLCVYMHYITSLTKIPPIFNQNSTPFLYILSMKICSVYMCFSSRFSTTICSGKNAVARCRRKTLFCKIYNYAVACRPFTTLYCLASLFVFNSVQDTKPRLRNLTHFIHPLCSPIISAYYTHPLNSRYTPHPILAALIRIRSRPTCRSLAA